jgi:hypothetical protein
MNDRLSASAENPVSRQQTPDSIVAPVFLRDRKFTRRFALRSHARATVERAGSMHVQEQEVRRNYIGIVCDGTEEQRAVEQLSQSAPFMRDYLRGLLAALFSRRGRAA